MHKSVIKKSLGISILFLCVFIQVTSVSAAKKSDSEEFDAECYLYEFFNPYETGNPSNSVAPEDSETETNSHIMQYSYFIGTDGNHKLRVQRRLCVPIHEEYGQYQFFDETIGEWDIEDPYVQQTFEFIGGNLCRYRQ
jgi:hypothetical protein